MIAPLRLSFVVRCPAAHAFDVWTAQTSRWWPLSHTVTEEKGLHVVVEPRPGGRIFERTPTGEEIDLGWITAWEPPHRLVYQWHINADRSDATEVEITFTDQPDGATQVEIEHRGWERLGAAGAIRRDRNRAGWDAVLPHFTRLAGASRS